jgi:hypothetical protein
MGFVQRCQVLFRSVFRTLDNTNKEGCEGDGLKTGRSFWWG